MKTLLLAAGRSRRVKPIEDKNFLKFFGFPLIAFQISRLSAAGFNDILLVAGAHNKDRLSEIAAHQMAMDPDLKIQVLEQKNLDEGMAGAVLTVEEAVGKETPEGFKLMKVSRIPIFFPSLEALLNRADFEVSVPPELALGKEELISEDGLARFLNQEGLAIEKLKKKAAKPKIERILLKPLILEFKWNGKFSISLKFGPGKNVKPEKIVGLLLSLTEDQARALRVRRKSFWVEKPDGTAVEP